MVKEIKNKKKLYQTLVDDLMEQISLGVYQPGNKLPSIRTLATQRKVSIATVLRALEELESRGLITAKPQSGFYVRMPLQSHVIPPSTMLPLTPKSVKVHRLASDIFHQCEKPGVINLGVSYPASDYAPEQYLQKIATRVVKQKVKDILTVHFSAGYPLLREVLAMKLNQSGCGLVANDLIITNGCLEALSICLRAVANPGDTIAVESPGFVGLFQLIESLGYKALEIPCHPTEGMSLQALELALSQWDIKAVAVVPSFSNPLGSHMPEINRRHLVELLAERDIPLIEDDLLSDLAFDGSRTKPCKAFDSKGLVLYCSSASKTIASGLRVGWIAPGNFYREVEYFKTFTNISAANFAQIVIAEFLQSGRYERYIRQLTALLAQQMYRFQQAIEHFFPVGTLVSRPQGGCILWVVLPGKINGLEFFNKALSLNIAIIPGQVCSTSDKFDHCIRINSACDPNIDIDRCIKQLGRLAHSMINAR